MIMRCIKTFLNLALFLSISIVMSQDNFRALGESALSVDHKFSKVYNANFSFRSRYILHDTQGIQYQQQQVDLFHFSTFSLNYNKDRLITILRKWNIY